MLKMRSFPSALDLQYVFVLCLCCDVKMLTASVISDFLRKLWSNGWRQSELSANPQPTETNLRSLPQGMWSSTSVYPIMKKKLLKVTHSHTHTHIQNKVTTVYSNMFISLSLKNEFLSGRRDGRLFPGLVNKCLFYGHNSFLEVQYAVCQTFSVSLSSHTLMNRGITYFIPNSHMPAHEFKKHGTLQPPRHPRVFLRHFKYALD